MNLKKPALFLWFSVALLVHGILLAGAGVLYVDGALEKDIDGYHAIDIIASSDIKNIDFVPTIHGESFLPSRFNENKPGLESAPAAEKGLTVGEFMRYMGIASVALAVIILICIEFLFKNRIRQNNYRILLIISLFVLPVLVTMSASTTVMETTKSVQSCNTCHIMEPFVNDLSDPESPTLAARHFKNKWISQYQCYTCHTTYGAHGTLEGKRDGFRHWLLYVTGTWNEPIRYSGSYPNQNCVACHGGTSKFTDVNSHIALSKELSSDRVSCTSCHGPAHPVPGDRNHITSEYDQANYSKQFHGKEIEPAKIQKIVEAFNGKK